MPAILAVLVSMLRAMLLAKAGLFVLKVLGFFGLAFVTNKYAIQPMLDQIEQYVNNIGNASGIGAVALQWAGVLNLDKAVSMIISAFSTAALIKQSKTFLGVKE